MEKVPTSDIIQRVFAISADGNSCGSALAYPIGSFIYFITAAHVLDGMEHGIKSNLYIFKDNIWTRTEATPYYVAEHKYIDGDIDLAIVKTPLPAGETSIKATLSVDKVILGQDVYFLGFPYFGNGIHHPPNNELNKGFPIPFIKKATLSAIQNPMIYLDCHNNPGFSGGPVVFWDHQQKKHKILGVVSAYLTQKGEIKKIETSVKEFYEENSGIGIAYNIDYINKLIEKMGWLTPLNPATSAG